jgi:hypothetical protein
MALGMKEIVWPLYWLNQQDYRKSFPNTLYALATHATVVYPWLVNLYNETTAQNVY